MSRIGDGQPNTQQGVIALKDTKGARLDRLGVLEEVCLLNVGGQILGEDQLAMVR
jgi:hypothetical protein